MTCPPTSADEFERRVVAEIPHLRSFLRGLAGEDAEDLLQDVMERALRYRHAFDRRRGPLRSWLSKTAFRAFVDRRARAEREPVGLGERDVEVAAAPGSAASARGGAFDLEPLLARLSAREREVLVRFHAGGEALADIAAESGLPLGTVKSHLHRARRKLAARDPERGTLYSRPEALAAEPDLPALRSKEQEARPDA